MSYKLTTTLVILATAVIVATGPYVNVLSKFKRERAVDTVKASIR